MTLVLVGKDLVVEGFLILKIEDKKIPGRSARGPGTDRRNTRDLFELQSGTAGDRRIGERFSTSVS